MLVFAGPIQELVPRGVKVQRMGQGVLSSGQQVGLSQDPFFRILKLIKYDLYVGTGYGSGNSK